MKNSQSIVKARQNNILDYIESNGIATVNNLSKLFYASPLTIRRDLDELVKAGKIERYHGGAVAKERESADRTLNLKIVACKHAIAKQAATMVEDNDTIFINSSSTALLVLKYVTAKNVTVITNNAKALFAARPKDSVLFFTGGEIRTPKDAMVGEFAVNSVSSVTANKCFMGCAGVSPTKGPMSTVLQEASINGLMYRQTYGKRILLADYRRFDCIHPFSVCPITDITHIIYDSSVPLKTVEPYKKLGIVTIQAKTSNRI